MLVGVVAVEAAEADIVAGHAAALGVKFLDADLAHVGEIGHVGLAVVADHRLFVDPPVGVAALDADLFASFNVDHDDVCSFLMLVKKISRRTLLRKLQIGVYR